MALFGLLKDSKDPAGMSGNDKLALLFSGISDFGAMRSGQEANAIDSLTKAMQGRREKAAKEAALARVQSVVGGLFNGAETAAPSPISPPQSVGDYAPRLAPPEATSVPQSGVVGYRPATMQDAVQKLLPLMMDPATSAQATTGLNAFKMAQPDKATYIEGPDGIYEVGPNGPSLVQKYPEKPQAVSPGWEPNPDKPGAWRPVTDGPYDPGYIARTSGVRRDAIVSRPLPQRGGGGRGGGGRKISGRVLGPSLPSGY